MAQDLAKLTEALLDAARKAGAEAADALAIDGTSVSINVRQGQLEQAERSEGVDIGLRVLIGKRQACVSASDTRPETLQTVAERAVMMARLAPEDPTAGLADPSQIATQTDMSVLEMFDPSGEPSPETLKEDALRAEAAASAVEGISQVDNAGAAYGHRRIHLSATNGFQGGYERTDRMISAVAIAGSGTGMERDHCGESRIFGADLPSPEEIGRLAAERTLARMGARKPKTGAYPILYDERVASSLIGHLLSAINGSSIARGSSWLRDAMGEQVLPTSLSIIEDPLRPRTSASRLFDAEGLATQKRALVENGVLKSWVLDLASARKLGLESTGNASRGVSAPPSPSSGNVSLTQGEQSREDLIRDMGTGLLVTGMIGASVNPTTGDYSRGASGFWVENGEIAYPVNECTIAGNLRDMLKTLIPANDARTHLSRVVPSLLVEGMTLAGD
ncbi:TldD/PmbA family protein [Celeribacter litoreus]|uniref:TldD/PmbA family protein n=1 Tax=Celeribacter litoreus TaxID=2876714 RepID=UPI001CCE58AD|nr:TldD/PmbA family protein [Celeribacter litoreus]MCA0041936.1 TldD/PmbA family protein [Celeribacter litoreus]